MAESEKITVNMSVVDLGKIDLLVDEGFYSNRTDFIRTGVRNQLDKHSDDVKESATRRTTAMGIISYGRKALEKRLAKGERLKITVVGMFMLSDDVSPELADQTIESVEVYGVFRANKAVKAVLADRTR